MVSTSASKDNKVDLLEILLWFRLILTFVPAAGEFSTFIINVVIVVAIWVVLFTNAGSGYVFNKMGKFIPLYLITFVNLLFGVRSTTIPLFIYGIIQWFIYPVAITYLVENNKRGSVKRILFISLACIVITSITTIIGNEALPGASRALASGWRDDETQMHFLKQMNIGGFDFAYLLSLLFPLFVYVFKGGINRMASIAIIAVGAVAMYAVYKTEYTTALLFSVLGLCTMFLPRNYKFKQIAVVAVVGGIIAFMSVAALSTFFGNLSESSESGVIAERLGGISDILSGNQTGGDTEARQDVMNKSWKAFIASPIVGSGKGSVGGHSYILDTMGMYGMFGIIMLIIVFKALFKLFIKPYRNPRFTAHCCLLIWYRLHCAYSIQPLLRFSL